MSRYPQEERLSRAQVFSSAGFNTPLEYPSNEAALAAGLSEGQLYFDSEHPHTVRVALFTYLFSGDGLALVSGDGLDLTPLFINLMPITRYSLDASLTAEVVNERLLGMGKEYYLSCVDTTASITLPTVPTVYACPTVSVSSEITYNIATGIITFNVSSDYHLAIHFNVQPSVNNKNVYFYAEINTGSGWVIERFSARQRTLSSSSTTEQLMIVANIPISIPCQMRFYLWG